jgi:hypothetical protein
VVDERSVEIEARRDGGELTVAGQPQFDLASRRGAQRDVATGSPTLHGLGAKTERFEQAQGTRGEAVTAALVARKRGLVDHSHAKPQSVGRERGSDAGWACAHHEHVTVTGHARKD